MTRRHSAETNEDFLKLLKKWVAIEKATIKMTDNLLPSDYIPIFYIVKKGDTMYRIAKVYFRIPINEMLTRNNLESVELKIGQLLHVGWININGISEDSRKNKGGPMARRNFAMKKVYLRDRAHP